MNCASARCRRATCAAHHHEARAGELRAGGEVEPAERRRRGRRGPSARNRTCAASPQRRSSRLSSDEAAERDRLVRDVRDAPQEVLRSPAGASASSRFGGFERSPSSCSPCSHQRPSHPAPWPWPGRSPWRAVALGLRLLDRGLDLLALLPDRWNGVEVECAGAARREPLRDAVGVLPKQLDVDHLLGFLSVAPSFSRIFASRPRSVGRYHCTGGMPSGK